MTKRRHTGRASPSLARGRGRRPSRAGRCLRAHRRQAPGGARAGLPAGIHPRGGRPDSRRAPRHCQEPHQLRAARAPVRASLRGSSGGAFIVTAELSSSQCRDAFVELTAGTLSPADRLAVERHLVSCAECQRERDAWLALGDAIRERGQHLPTDGGFATGLVRLRTAVMLHDGDDFEHPHADGTSMEGDPLPTAGATPMHGRSYPALTVTVAVVLLSALIFGALATRLHLSSGHAATGTARPPATPTATPFASATPHPMPPLPAGASVVSISMISASDGWAAATAGEPRNAIFLPYAGGPPAPPGGPLPRRPPPPPSLGAPPHGGGRR